mmetsp:Transcript_7358/g.16884  ORF Transcript_7358/g.16884 Transcript_7358/m.16884 type:complete len:129 (-) Transcript_7358:201-587(-)
MAEATVVPEFEDLKKDVREIKLANPEMGIAKIHAAVKEKNPTWQVSQDRVKKLLSEMVVMQGGKVIKGQVNKSDPTLTPQQIARKKTEAALAKKREEAKKKAAGGAAAGGGPNKADIGSWRPGGDISH